MQIIDGTGANSDVVVHCCHRGESTVKFEPIPTYDLSHFTPLEYLGAYYLEQDYTEGYATIAHDFLA